MKRVFAGLFIATGAVVLAIGVLACAERLLANDPKRSRHRRHEDDAIAPPAAVPAPMRAATTAMTGKPAQRNFTIRRTKSEVGFVYWMLEGHGRYKCFILCDSWAEAVEQGQARMTEIDGVASGAGRAPALAS